MNKQHEMQEYMEDEKIVSTEKLREQFEKDTVTVAKQTELFLKSIYPSYFVDTKEELKKLSYSEADIYLNAFTFYRLVSCTIEEADDIFKFLNQKMEKFYTALYSLERPIIYGIVSYQGITNLVMGIMSNAMQDDTKVIKGIMEGLLGGIELQPYVPHMVGRKNKGKEVGVISGIPTVKIGENKQQFDISPLMKSLNGQEYMIFFVSRPLPQNVIAEKLGEIIQIRDECFAVSKRNISRQQGTSHSESETNGRTETDTYSTSISKSTGVNIGASIILLGAGVSRSKSRTEGNSHSTASSYSESITDAINQSEGIASDVQNGFALEMINYADTAIERLKQGKSNGMWETAITYSANSEAVAGIIKACISGEMAKPNSNILPGIVHSFHLDSHETMNNSILIPKIIMNEKELSPLCTAVTSEELGLMCTLPSEVVPNFELKKGKAYPLVTDSAEGIKLGHLCEGKRNLLNMPFSLLRQDLIRHTFVCGITGSGKTTTVKKILREANIPFLVIESAKKEYRNIKMKDGYHPQVYTLGKPEINCLRFNPFYIQCGVSPQMHIDFLKDLFNASFSFYGPMPYIMEKCLQNIYRAKGWNLTLGFHPYLVNFDNSADLFEVGYMKKKYAMESHKYLFPTMQDLKEEIERYIEEDMQYEGEVAGNIKTAIKARLESLCSGSKGYMFNTYEYANMSDLLNRNTVFELEGLADDSDKAFCVGLLIIYINEYRQISNEVTQKNGETSHLLVIEEAHRLLKNIDTKRVSEEMGNPKGKAVEHFTNMLAEMRSYGQGVIVAEQIPSKLASDVIKNSSNKIIQRLVAADDQELVANTIGLNKEYAVNLGSLRTGMALCHKEGMGLPVAVKILPTDEIHVTDGMLYCEGIVERFHRINYSLAKEAIADKIDLYALKMLNTILTQRIDETRKSVEWYQKQIKKELVKKNVVLLFEENEKVIWAEIMTEAIIQYLMNGVYSIKCLIDNNLSTGIKNLLMRPDAKRLELVKILLRKAYKDDPAGKAKNIITQLIFNRMTGNMDLVGSIEQYFIHVASEDVINIKHIIEERC